VVERCGGNAVLAANGNACVPAIVFAAAGIVEQDRAHPRRDAASR
jgi:hypothetical protein